MKRRLSRLGRLTVTLVVVSVVTAAALTWDSHSPFYVMACVVCAGMFGLGLAIVIDDFDHHRHRRVVVGRRRWE